MGSLSVVFDGFFSLQGTSFTVFSMISTGPSNNFGWFLLIPLILILMAWVFTPSIWAEFFSYTERTKNPQNIASKTSTFNPTVLFLVINYLVSGLILVTLYIEDWNLTVLGISTIVLIGAPVLHAIFSLLIMFLTEEKLIFRLNGVHIYYQLSLSGLLFYIASVVLFLYPSNQLVVLVTLGVALFLINALRWILGSIKAIQLRLSPFYIILYLCTLEILPLMLVYVAIN